LATLAELPGVFEALEAARGAVDGLLRELRGPDLRRRGAQVAALALRRSAAASATLELAALGSGQAGAVENAEPPFGDDPVGRTSAGAWRVAADLTALAPTWERAPGQALARLHTLAAAGLADPESLGRPDPGVPGGARRLVGLADLLTTPTQAPALVVAAVVHGEIVSVRPFGTADGVVARAAARLVTTGRGLDPTGVAVPEAGHVTLGVDAYQAAVAAYATGSPDGVAHWVSHCAQAMALGARVGRELASAGPAADPASAGPAAQRADT
jgi:hypothetical protein